ncbi:MAG: preprotein translocase subunit SecY [Candidatus Bathyarchaeota archaeon]|nr:preprotein translocase subunit SecY [Candidatus Bathyarchaeota archaeon]MDH5688171.1 preprotein translocase subunit SecY [Candidatus Bathyarchaeota archaeon]
MAGRFLRLFEPFTRLIPEVRPPERRVKFSEKLFWTAAVLVVFFVMGEVPLYGLARAGAQDALYYYRVIFASSRGTLMELGIGPIVTAGLILQLLSGSGFIECDFSNPDDRALFTGASKVLSIVMTGAQASAYLFGGLFGSLNAGQSVVIFIQLLSAGIVLMLMDELVQKGWGIGSGISLFIMAGVAQNIMWDCLAMVPAPGSEPPRVYGVLAALIGAVATSNSLDNIIVSPKNYPSILGLIATFGVFLFVIYAEGVRVELPLAHARYRGFRGRYPIKLLYVSNLPVIFASALFGNVFFISQLLWSNFNSSNSNVWLNLLGQFNATEGRSEPIGGLAYYMIAPRGFADVTASTEALFRSLVYACILIVFCVLFSFTWLEVGGLDPRTVAGQLVSSGMQIPGFRRSEKPIEMLLRRYIPIVTVLGGLVVGLLAAVADFMGAFGTGTGILLTVGIIYQYYQELVKERVTEMYPGFQRILGG